MALRKLAGPFEFKDTFGDYHPAYPILWVDELDGFLADGSWRREPADSGSIVAGQGAVQMDGTLTPRASREGTTPAGASVYDYDRVRRKLVFPNPSAGLIYLGIDWMTLRIPYSPETLPLAFTGDGVHTFRGYRRAYLPDRMLLIGQTIASPVVTKIFSLPYSGAGGTPVAEHTLQTETSPGSGIFDSWSTSNDNQVRFIQSATPEQTVFIVRNSGTEWKAVEYDFISKKTVGWVRKLGAQPDLQSASGIPGGLDPHILGFSVKHKVWAVGEDAPYPYNPPFPDEAPQGIWGSVSFRKRMWLFADEAVPATLSNPIALSPTRSGEAVRYRVRLAGADAEPCIGHRVNWTCSALGTVLIPQSVTDSDGYAETLVAYPPRADGPVEGTTITAEVVF